MLDWAKEKPCCITLIVIESNENKGICTYSYTVWAFRIHLNIPTHCTTGIPLLQTFRPNSLLEWYKIYSNFFVPQ